MLIIKCAKCKSKIMKYEKIGMGRVLRCWKSKISRLYEGEISDKKLICKNCGNVIGKIEAEFIKMNKDSFTYTGTKTKK